ncbi:helix-turn-helix domain-containing protein [Hymenobacter sp. BT770]|uniref:helix-turn-helix domain-containing protein n=1 Tax=Hymenobacter sp. BT770 TaxID=2886942 RepID=UPI001D10A219|nr:helix-turn-helix domain-containing protein [Hymenobacter sp. BT770]MCC3155247.1 helix-turn-helix domain-containing protein [Hymenobacter sp. BT770]MDO3417203.1 helix-turn-helix domain-containing protein [Hymenobacter sp. BT770]
MTLTEAEHEAAVKEFRTLVAGEGTNHARLLQRDALHAFAAANGHHPGPLPPVAGRLQLEMFRRRLKQKQLAQLLEVGESRLSQVLRGRRPANGDFLRRMYQKLGIPAEEVLELTS